MGFNGLLLSNLLISACNSDVSEELVKKMKAEYECQVCFRKGEENAALVRFLFINQSIFTQWDSAILDSTVLDWAIFNLVLY